MSLDNPFYPAKILHVFAQNDAAEFHNQQMLTRITDRDLYSCLANDSVESAYGTRMPTFPTKANDTGNLLQLLKVKVGARVILTNNLDVSDGLTNGAFGTVTCIVLNKNPSEQQVATILVQFDSPEAGRAAKAKSMWKKYYPNSVPINRVEVQFPLMKGKVLQTASRQQFPLFLAWGVTIHKVQGMTLPQIVVEMDPTKGKFWNGQAYVALSRVTSLEGLHILNYCLGQIKVEKEIKDEMEHMRKQQVECLPEPSLPSKMCDIIFAQLNINGLRVSGVDKSIDLASDAVIQFSDVVCLSETHLSSFDTLTGDFWEKFDIHQKDRNERGGGVLIAAKKTLGMKVINLRKTFLEVVGVEISKEEETINVFCVYLPPMTNKLLAADELKSLVQDFISETCVVTGDMNEDVLGESESRVKSMFASLGFAQHIKHPTSIYGSLLDHMYINRTHNIHAEVSEVYFSDHDIICASLLFNK